MGIVIFIRVIAFVQGNTGNLSILIRSEVQTFRIEVNGNDRVEIFSVRQHILLFGAHVHQSQINTEFLVQQLGTVAESQVIMVGKIVFCGSREVALVDIGTGRKTDMILNSVSGMVEVGRVPGGISGIRSCIPLIILILKLRHDERFAERSALRHMNGRSAGSLPFLGGDKNGTVGGIASVQRGCRRTGENRDIFYIFGIKRSNGIGGQSVSGVD